MLKRILAVALLASGCSSIPRATRDGRITDIWSQISTKDYIRVRGVGAVPAGLTGETARRGASRNAALVAARYELLAIVKGVKLEGGLSISQLMSQSSIVREIADDLVKGGEEVQTEWLRDDGAVTTLELKRSTVERLIQKGSPRERALAAEVKRLNRLLAVAIHNDFKDVDMDEVRAVKEKAEAVADAQKMVDDLQSRIDAGYQPTMPEIISIMNRVQALKSEDPKKMAEDARWGREHLVPFTLDEYEAARAINGN